MTDQVLCSGVACITDLMVKERLVNLDFAHVCSIMSEMGTAMIETGEAMGERRALRAPKAAIANRLLATPITPPKRFAGEQVPRDRLIAG
jgi:cell division GTPase FtsZ